MTTVDSRARSVVRTLESYQPGRPIEDVKRALKLSSVIKLASNENALGPSPKAVAALKKAVGSLNRYPDASCSLLRERLSKWLRVDPESVIVGNGSDELIVLALRAFVDPGDEVIVAYPTFLIYELQARACAAKVRRVPLKDYRYDLSAMGGSVSPHTKLVFIANPDNPTGTYVTKQELNNFLGGLSSNTLVVIDEAYYEFVTANDYPQTIPLVTHHPVIITRSFSKAYGLAGLRVGYGISQPSIIAAMNSVREPFNVNSLAQVAAAAALDDHEFLARSRRMVKEGRAYLLSELSALKLRVVPSVTNFVLIEIGTRASQVAQALLSKGIIVREMTAWHLDGCLRVSIGTMQENRRFIRELKRCLSS